ncbi:MAG TPA: hypothetical protein VH257_17810, partial [Chloroflexota bacterium]|nr:hypothetical protein [Chloroflexota bacterium]
MSETTGAPAPERQCHGSCGLPIPADKGTSSTVIGPARALREFCDAARAAGAGARGDDRGNDRGTVPRGGRV